MTDGLIGLRDMMTGCVFRCVPHHRPMPVASWGLWQEAAENGSRPPDTRQAVLALLSRDPEALIVAEHDGVLIGSVIAGWDGWRYHLYRLAVRPNWRRQGV